MDRKIYLEFEELYKRIWSLKQELKDVVGQQISNSDKLVQLESSIESNSNNLESQKSSIDGLIANVNSINTTLTNVNNSVTSINGSITTLTNGQNTLKNNINTISMCPNGIFLHKTITNITTSGSVVYTATVNCIATIRGVYNGLGVYYVNSHNTNSMYQWVSDNSSATFLLASGDSIMLEGIYGNPDWADLYVEFTKGV